MHTTLHPVPREERHILGNLLEKYLYEFSQYELLAFNEEGLFGYDYLDNYWTEADRAAYFIRVEGRLAGFVLLYRHAERRDRPVDWSVAEFFVAYPYRRRGVGSAAMAEVFARYPGHWQIGYHPKNLGSAAFWRSAAEKAASGPVEAVTGDQPYKDGSPAQVLCFHV